MTCTSLEKSHINSAYVISRNLDSTADDLFDIDDDPVITGKRWDFAGVLRIRNTSMAQAIRRYELRRNGASARGPSKSKNCDQIGINLLILRIIDSRIERNVFLSIIYKLNATQLAMYTVSE